MLSLIESLRENDMPDIPATPSVSWSLYIVQTSSGMLYTGITTDVTRRLKQHQSGKGAKALRGKGELTLVFQQKIGERGMALKQEYQVKKMSRAAKLELIRAYQKK